MICFLSDLYFFPKKNSKKPLKKINQGEVLSGLQSKMKYSQDEGFVCLVAERVPPLPSLPLRIGGSSKKKEKSSAENDEDEDTDLAALDEFSTSDDSSSLPSIAGVVEVSLQGEKRELESLWGVTGLVGSSGGSSSSNNDNNGGGDGDETTSSNSNSLIKGLFGGWNALSSSPLLSSDSTEKERPIEGLYFDESYAYVACMAVDERCRRSGAASALLRAAERAAGRWRQNWVLLHVHEKNSGARALYASAGYAPLGPAERPGIVGAPRVLMGKQSGVPSSSSSPLSSSSSSSSSSSLFSFSLSDDDAFSDSLSSTSAYSNSSSSVAPSIMSIPSDLLGALKRDSEERAAKSKAAKAKKREEEEEEQRGG